MSNQIKRKEVKMTSLKIKALRLNEGGYPDRLETTLLGSELEINDRLDTMVSNGWAILETR